MANPSINAYLQNIKKLKLTKSTFGLSAYLEKLFKGIGLKEKTVLDIGAGAGIYSCYMAINGAEEVISLEPQIEGSKNSYISNFEELKGNLNLSNVFLKPVAFQSFESDGENFDVILLHYSINHLDENACMNLKKTSEAQKTYEEIFSKLYSISKVDADLIMADCSNKNFFNSLGIKNPFVPAIEWNKHQSPEEWIKILKRVGFKNFKIRWVIPWQFGGVADFFLGNKVCSFFIHSHFIIYAKK